MEELRTGVHCGWLHLKDDGVSYELADCGEPEKVAMSELPQWYQKEKNKDAVEKAQAFKESGLGFYPKWEGKCLVCSGEIYMKAHEQLVSPHEDCVRTLSVTAKDVDRFKSVYKPSPYYEFIDKQLQSGEWLPVFFKRHGKEGDKIGFTRMFRYPYRHRVSDGVMQRCYACNGQETKGRDLTECIFGYVDKKEALRGRVQVGNAFVVGLGEKEIEEKRGVLGQPMASFYPYYLRQTDSPHKTYDSDDLEIAGRKRYRVHGNNNITETLPQGNDNERTKTTLRLLPKGNKFVCEIKFHNLCPIEIGALLSAMTFHKTAECHHNIGMGKAFGCGKIEVSDVALSFLKYEADYYLREFEKCMTHFTICSMRKNWIETEQLQALFAIATDHEEPLDYMELPEYARAKRTKNFDTLKEKNVLIKSLLTGEDALSMFDSDYETIETKIHSQNYDYAISLCDALLGKQLPTDVRGHIAELRDKAESERGEWLRKQKEEEAQLQELYIKLLAEVKGSYASKEWTKVVKKCEEAMAEPLPLSILEGTDGIKDYLNRAKNKLTEDNAGLAAFLDEKYPNGEFKVKDFKLALSKIDKWRRDHADAPLTPIEEAAVQQTLHRIFNVTTKKPELREWNNPDSKYWKRLAGLLGSEEKANNIYQYIHNQQL